MSQIPGEENGNEGEGVDEKRVADVLKRELEDQQYSVDLAYDG